MPIDRHAIQDRLKKFDLGGLFTQELGWDWHAAKLSVTTGDLKFELVALAQKRGMVAWHCPVAAGSRIPDYPTHEHLIIFTDAAKTQQVWQWVKRETGKPARCREHTFHSNQSGEALIQKLQAIAFTHRIQPHLHTW